MTILSNAHPVLLNTGNPNGVVAAAVGSIKQSTDGTFWINKDGATGWGVVMAYAGPVISTLNPIVGSPVSVINPLLGYAPLVSFYLWQLSTDGQNWTTVGSGSTYTPLSGDVGKYLRVQILPIGSGAGIPGAGSFISQSTTPIVLSSLLQSLLAFWALSENTGTRFDSSVNAVNLSSTNSVSSQAATIGSLVTNVASFNGSNNYLSASTVNLLQSGPQFTACAWANMTSANWGMLTDATFQLYTGHGGSNGMNAYIFGLALNVTDNVNRLNQWHFYAMTYNGSGSLKAYVDGALIGSVSGAGNVGSDSTGVHIGCNYNASFFSEGAGSLQGPTAFWSRELSAAAITALYNSGTPVPYSSLSTMLY